MLTKAPRMMFLYRRLTRHGAFHRPLLQQLDHHTREFHRAQRRWLPKLRLRSALIGSYLHHQLRLSRKKVGEASDRVQKWQDHPHRLARLLGEPPPTSINRAWNMNTWLKMWISPEIRHGGENQTCLHQSSVIAETNLFMKLTNPQTRGEEAERQ